MTKRWPNGPVRYSHLSRRAPPELRSILATQDEACSDWSGLAGHTAGFPRHPEVRSALLLHRPAP